MIAQRSIDRPLTPPYPHTPFPHPKPQTPKTQAATDKLASAASSSSATKYLTDAEITPRALDRLLFHCEKLLAPVRQCRPSLLHGNLWQAKCGALKDGRRAFALDPACWCVGVFLGSGGGVLCVGCAHELNLPTDPPHKQR